MALTPRDTKGHLEESQAGELAASLQEKLKATQLAGELARQEMRAALELVRAAGPRPVSLRGLPPSQASTLSPASRSSKRRARPWRCLWTCWSHR